MLKHFAGHKRTEAFCLVLTLLLFASITAFSLSFLKHNEPLPTVFAYSNDKSITLSWEPGSSIQIHVSLSDGNDMLVDQVLSGKDGQWSYTDGCHGMPYWIRVYPENEPDNVLLDDVRLFLDYDRLPALPLICVETCSGNEPASTPVTPDVSLWGASVIDNDYEFCTIQLSGFSSAHGIADGKIRVRGNTSAIAPKKSFKLKFDRPVDLLGISAFASDDWVLIRGNCNLNEYLGRAISSSIGSEWTPQGRFVNLLLNGDWRGCYFLSECVSMESSHGLVGKNGCIYENDAYWWNENGLYFRTAHQPAQLGYTLKYPSVSSVENRCMVSLQTIVETYEEMIFDGNVQYRDYIDETSFARWILGQDIMGNGDGGGSNFYYYIFDFNHPEQSNVKMGPLWDFDKAFFTTDEWSSSSWEICSFFPQLFAQQSFQDNYRALWAEVSPKLYDEVCKSLEFLNLTSGAALDESFLLNARRWGEEYCPLDTQIENALNWYQERIEWMNAQIFESPDGLLSRAAG